MSIIFPLFSIICENIIKVRHYFWEKSHYYCDKKDWIFPDDYDILTRGYCIFPSKNKRIRSKPYHLSTEGIDIEEQEKRAWFP